MGPGPGHYEERGKCCCGLGYSVLVRRKQEEPNQSRGRARNPRFTFPGQLPFPRLLPQAEWRVPGRTYTGANGPKSPYHEFPLPV